MTSTTKSRADISTLIPIVDLGKFLNGTEEEKNEVAKEIDKAFCTVGFVYLRNHGVARELVEECFAWSKKFFDLPMEKKMLAPHPPGSTHHRGYAAPGVEKLSQDVYDKEEIAKISEDYKESFNYGNPQDTMQPNIFPPPHILPGFQPFITSYFSHCTTLVNNLLHVLSYALNLPAPGLAPTHASAMFHLRLLHYPEIAAKELSGGCGKGLKRSRINAHSDFGSLTLLFQDSIGGLEVQDPSNDRFRPAPPIRDTVLVNIGDLMARWSNGRWASTVHRVGVPDDVAYTKLGSKEQNGDKGETIVPSRYSIPFFAVPDADTVIEALDGCWDEDTRPKIYEPVTAGAYVQMRLAALYNK